jgi:Fe-S-cluster containining protein
MGKVIAAKTPRTPRIQAVLGDLGVLAANICPVPRLRLAILGESPCGLCHANCCKQNGHDYAVLLEGDERRRFAPFAVEMNFSDSPGAPPRIERVLPYLNGRCQFLDDDDRCAIYTQRPVNCRRFQCVPGYHSGGSELSRHSEFLRRNPDVLALLERM